MTIAATRPLGSILVDAKVLSAPSLADALENQRESGKRLGAVLVEMGLVDDQTIVAALGIQSDLPVTDLRHRRPDPHAVALVPERLARMLSAAPVRRTPHGLEVAVADPLDQAARALLEKVVGEPTVMLLARADDVLQMIDRSYLVRPRPRRPAPGGLRATGHTGDREAPEPDEPQGPPPDLGDELLQSIVADAVRAGATDIHVAPRSADTRLRYRIDGTLTDAAALPSASGAAVVRCAQRLVGEAFGSRGARRRFDLTVDGRPFRVLVATSMTIHGERLWLRVVAGDAEGLRRLDQLGMPAAVRRSLAAELHMSSGLIVIAGPRGSGRTTTAYAAVAEMDTLGRSVVTVQRMATHVLPSVSQIEIGTDAVVPALLAAVRDQDVDGVVIDDLEGVGVTRAAIRMAQRGLLVVLTVTAMDAKAAAAHVLDTGVPQSLLTSTLHAVLTQRLGPPIGSGRSARRVATFELHR